MYMHRYSTPYPPSSSKSKNGSKSSSRFHHHRPVTRRSSRPSTSHNSTLSKPAFLSTVGTSSRRKSDGGSIASSRPSTRRKGYHQSTRTSTVRTSRKPHTSRYNPTATKVKASPIIGLGVDAISIKGTKKKKSNNHDQDLRDRHRRYSHSKYNKFKDSSSAISMVNQSTLMSLQNLRSGMNGIDTSRSVSGRTYTKTRRKSHDKSKELSRSTQSTARKGLRHQTSPKSSGQRGSKRRSSKSNTSSASSRAYRKMPHGQNTLKMPQKLQYLYKHSSHNNIDEIRDKKENQNQMNRDLLFHHQASSSSTNSVASRHSAKGTRTKMKMGRKMKATVSSQSHTARRTPPRDSKKTKKSRSAHMIPQQQSLHKKNRIVSGAGSTATATATASGSGSGSVSGPMSRRNSRREIGDRLLTRPMSKKRDSRSISDSQISRSSLTMKDLQIKSLLGEGAFSKVFLVELKDTANVRRNVTEKLLRSEHTQIALKVIPRKTSKKEKKNNKNLMWERLVLSQLDHPFIVQYFGSFYDEKRVCILMEFIIGGEILYHFENCRLGRFPPTVSRFYIAEIICALEYVHSTGFIYRDLKPENVLLDHRGHIKLVDFGFAKQLAPNELTYTLCGSKEYVAPEVLVGNGHNGNVDLWSLGVLTFEFIIGHLPFPTQDSNPYQVLDIIRSTKLVFPHFVSKIIEDFIKKLLTFNPAKRIGHHSFADIKKHQWFDEFDWDKCNAKKLKPPIAPKFSSDDDVTNFANARFEENVHEQAFNDLKLF